MIRSSVWMGAGGTGALFLALAWFLPPLLGLEGAALWIVRGVLGSLGLIAALLVGRMVHLRSRGRTPKRRDPGTEKLELAFKEAQNRLKASSAGASRIDRLPVILVMGPHGGTKTTVISRSGLDPELLAGEVQRDDSIVPTEGVNLWYGDGVVLVEAGADVMEEPGHWSDLLSRLRPARLRAALLRQPQAPRVAVVCVGCDELLEPGAATSVPELARGLRQKLADAAHELGIQLPVYVLLTKADRIPHFDEFAAALSGDEAVEVLGATLPLRAFSSSGSYGDEQSRRIRSALGRLHRSLGRKRLELLPREAAEGTRHAAYEFPREVHKLEQPVGDFLVELCRPGHLGTSPILRGFYFVGVRPVYVSGPTEEAPPPTSTSAQEPATAGATSVFKAPGMDRPAGERRSGSTGPSTRKVPQWVFLPRVFQNVILRDRTAMGVTGSGVRVSLMRRIILGGATVAALVLLAGMTVSFVQNRSLQQDVADRLRAVAATPPVAAQADAGVADAGVDEGAEEPEDAGDRAVPIHYLQQLDALGSELSRLREWEEGRPPLRFRWGLYRGSHLLTEVRTAYFQRFRDVLWGDTRARLLAFLDGLPAEPGEDSDYEETYNALKAYLMTTDHPDEAEGGFLAPVLLSHWEGAASGEPDERAELARRQFRVFATELHAAGNPYTDFADPSRVASVQGFLGDFAAVDQFYQALVSRVSAELGTFQFDETYPFASAAVRSDVNVPGAFTREGWDTVHQILADPEGLLVSEEWVVGEQVVSPEDRVALAGQIEDRYVDEYVAVWQEFLRTGSVRRFESVSQAADRLHLLSGRDSPIVYMLAEASRNTSVNSDRVRSAFQPVHLMYPPEGEEGEDVTRVYLDGLVNLQASLDQLAGASGPRMEQSLIQAERDASQARASISQLTRDFDRDGPARLVGDHVSRLLEEPILHTTGFLGGYMQAQAAGEINQAGADFCRRFDEVAALYPFSAGAGTEASMEDVRALFQPGESRMSAFHEEVLDELITRQGGRWEARSGATPAPAGNFLAFYNQADQVARALFTAGGDGPQVSFFLRMETSGRVPEVQVEVDGQSQRYTQTAAPTRDFFWDGGQARMVRLSGQVDGAQVTFLEEQGPWAIFRLFQQASRWEALGGGIHLVTWRIPAHDVEISADVTFADAGQPVFRSDFLALPRCVPQVVR